MKKLLTFVVFPVIIVALAYFIVSGINKPVKFDREQKAREKIAIQQLKDIRTLQNAYKSTYSHYAPTMDSLVDFYNNGHIKVVMMMGSEDDSVAVANTAAIKKKNPKITNEELLNLYRQGQKLVFNISTPIPVKDTLFNDNPSFNPESLRTIPFSGGDTVIMRSVIKVVSGVNVPLFEAQIPYPQLLKGMDEQLIVNLYHIRTDTDRYPGLMVGSIDNPNNNAGNWE